MEGTNEKYERKKRWKEGGVEMKERWEEGMTIFNTCYLLKKFVLLRYLTMNGGQNNE